MEEPRKEEITEEGKQTLGLPTRSCIFMTLAGLYLVYTGYRLCRNVLDGVEGGSWGFMAAGVVFCVIGIGMVVVGGRGLMRNEKEKKAAEAAEKTESAVMNQKVVEEKPTESGKKMSITERANLVNKVMEEEHTSEDAQE